MALSILRSLWGYSFAAVWTLICATTAAVSAFVDRRGLVWWPASQWWARGIHWAAGVRGVRHVRLEILDAHVSAIVMSNHESHLDVPALIRLRRRPLSFLTKKVLFYVPFFGWSIWMTGHIPIDRSNRKKAFASIDKAAKMVADGRTVVIFPEGTRAKTAELGRFKKGGFVLAIKSGVPIVPVGVAGTRHLLPKGLHLLDKRGPVAVVVGEPIDTKGHTLDSKDALMGLVRERIAALREEARELVAG